MKAKSENLKSERRSAAAAQPAGRLCGFARSRRAGGFRFSLSPARFPLLAFFCTIWLFAFVSSPRAQRQEPPGEIRGYKVHLTKVSVKSEAEKKDRRDQSEAFVSVGDPVLVETALTGLTFELEAAFEASEQSGRVDFLSFQDFTVNGLRVEVEEYRQSFEFKKKARVKLPAPIKIFLGSGQALKGALAELKDSKDEWTVSGTVFVFGRFKKLGFEFKRVVPVRVSVKIKNPLKNGTAPAARPSFILTAS